MDGLCLFAEIVDLVKRYPAEGEAPLRPDVLCLQSDAAEESVLGVMRDCWAEDPDQRPDFHTVRIRLKKMKGGK